jgi:hypothetical protein
VALPFAGLVAAARPRSRREWLAVALAGGAGIVVLSRPEAGLLDALGRAWSVLIAAAFTVGATLRPPRFWPLALRTCLYTAAGVAVLGPAVAGPAVWREVQWEATRGASGIVRRVIEVVPGLYPAFEPTVRLLADGWPVWLMLETLVGLALAWRAYARFARGPLGPVAAAS